MALKGLLKLVLLTLAFTNSATLPLGFPLKIYEVAGFAALFLMLVGGNIYLGGSRRIPLLWMVFLVGSLIASGWGLYELWSRDLGMLEWAHGRFDPLVNTVFHYIYLAFDIGLLVLVLHLLESRLMTVAEFIRWWMYGALLAVVYAVALNLVLAAGLPAAILLRFHEVYTMDVGGIPVVRNGPFEEGNYFGLYLLASLVINLYALRIWPGRFFRICVVAMLLGILITASPAALLGAGVLVLAALALGNASVSLKAGAVAVGVALLGFLIKTGVFQALVLDKFSLILMGGVTDTRNVSLIQRLNESYHAWNMFLDHPYGVGMGNFGYFFGYYPDLYTWLITDFNNFKPIPNNVYLEVLSEHGLIVFLLFLYILYNMLRRLITAREWLVTVGLLMIMVYFVAFPTFRLSLLWVFFAFVVFLGRDPGSPFLDPHKTDS